MINIVDPHIHFFDLAKGNYHWLDPNNPPFWPDKSVIQRNFSTADLCLSSDINLQGFVHIEAGFDNQASHKELEYLANLMKRNTTAYAAIAFIDLSLSHCAFKQDLSHLQKHTAFRGLRYTMDERSHEVLSLEQSQLNIAELSKGQFIFECQLNASDNTQTLLLMDILERFPDLRCIVNHAAMVPNTMELAWQKNMQAISAYSNVYLKCSGFEMANRNYTIDYVKDVMQACIDMYGEQRVMCASNFPLTLFSLSYLDYWQMVIECVKRLGYQANRLCYQNAIEIFSLDIQ